MVPQVILTVKLVSIVSVRQAHRVGDAKTPHVSILELGDKRFYGAIKTAETHGWEVDEQRVVE
jgi:hypothetical protein